MTAVTIGARPAAARIDIDPQAAVIGAAHVDRFGPGVGRGQAEAVRKAPVELDLHRMIARTGAEENVVRVGGAAEGQVEGLPARTSARNDAGVQVLRRLYAHAVVAHVGHFQREVARQGALHGDVPALNVRFAYAGGNHVVDLRGGVADNAVLRDGKWPEGREAIHHAAGFGPRVGGVEGVVLTHGKVVGVAVVRQRRPTDAIAQPHHGLFVVAIGRAEAGCEVGFVILAAHVQWIGADASHR